MQISVTNKKLKKHNKSAIKSTISTILIFLFLIISTAILVSVKKKGLAYEERIFYFVCVDSSKKSSELETKKELVKNLGGANTLYKINDEYNLIANVYLDLPSANEVRDNSMSYFPETKIIKVKSKALKKSQIKKIKSAVGAESFIKFLYSASNEFSKIQLDYLAGNMNDSEFLKKLVAFRLKLQEKLKLVSGEDEISQKILCSGELMEFQVTNFLSGFDIAKSKQNYVCNYFVGFYIGYVELFGSL